LIGRPAKAGGVRRSVRQKAHAPVFIRRSKELRPVSAAIEPSPTALGFVRRGSQSPEIFPFADRRRQNFLLWHGVGQNDGALGGLFRLSTHFAHHESRVLLLILRDACRGRLRRRGLLRPLRTAIASSPRTRLTLRTPHASCVGRCFSGWRGGLTKTRWYQ